MTLTQKEVTGGTMSMDSVTSNLASRVVNASKELAVVKTTYVVIDSHSWGMRSALTERGVVVFRIRHWLELSETTRAA